jgi:hypothetical protein
MKGLTTATKCREKGLFFVFATNPAREDTLSAALLLGFSFFSLGLVGGVLAQ